MSKRLVFEIRELDEVRALQPVFWRFAAELGFDRRAQWQIAIAASEAGTNMVKYGRGGQLTLQLIDQPRAGLRFEARDHGPGIADLERVLQDHISQGVDVRVRAADAALPGGLGTGLGAIQRLMDAFGWRNLADGGLLWAEKYL